MSLLQDLIEQVESKYPAVRYRDGGSRAEQAADLVRSQSVEYMGEQGGRDRWRVGEHICSIRGGCSCLDNHAPLDGNGRKLCRHRIAATFAYKLRQHHGLVPILEQAPGNRVILIAQVLYGDRGRVYTLNGYRYTSGEFTLDYAERIRFTEAEFAAALRATGWGMKDRPVRGAAMTYRYIIERGVQSEYNAGAMTAEDADTKAQRARMREIVALDAGDENEVLSGLPLEVQESIYRNAGVGR